MDYFKSPTCKLAMKARNGFVTFWLCAGLVFNALLVVAECVHFSPSLMEGTLDQILLRLVLIVTGLSIVAGYYLLISWRKVGFFLLSATVIIRGITNLCMVQSVVQPIIAIVSIFVLYLILHISKNGKSCWEQLS